MTARFFQDVTAAYHGDNPTQQALPSLLEMLIATSKAMSLLEGRPLRHGVRVAFIAGSIASHLDLPHRELISIVYAALLHDVGLARVAGEIAPRLSVTEKEIFYIHTLLNARLGHMTGEQPLSPEVRHMLASHPQAATAFLQALPVSDDVLTLVTHHHELCDGSGYPFGLSRDAIPLGARILSFADTVEAILHEVPGLNHRQSALETFLDTHSKYKFDAQVVHTFRSAVVSEAFIRDLSFPEVEEALHRLVGLKNEPLGGASLLSVAKALGGLSDSLLPHYTDNDSTQMAHWAVQMAERLGIRSHQVGELLLAALLHGLGKLSVPISTFRKQDALTPSDWQFIHDYPRLTGDVLKGLPGFGNVALWASEHQERMNGGGYPFRRRGVELSIASRILGIANVYNALTSPRPFRMHPYEPLDALQLLAQGKHRLYDYQLVGICRDLVLESEGQKNAAALRAVN